MKILADAITLFPGQGRLTLQVPEIDVNERDPSEIVTVPDNWFVWLKSNVPVYDKQGGWMHLTRKGWEANKDAICGAFASGPDCRVDDSVLVGGFLGKGYLVLGSTVHLNDPYLRTTSDPWLRRTLFAEWAERWFNLVVETTREKIERMRLDCVHLNMALDAATGKTV